jgi:hypothetical protein
VERLPLGETARITAQFPGKSELVFDPIPRLD